MKHLPDAHLLSMLKDMRNDAARLSKKIDHVYERLDHHWKKDHRIRYRFYSWRHDRLIIIHDNISAEIRRFSREARARGLRSYRGQGL